MRVADVDREPAAGAQPWTSTSTLSLGVYPHGPCHPGLAPYEEIPSKNPTSWVRDLTSREESSVNDKSKSNASNKVDLKTLEAPGKPDTVDGACGLMSEPRADTNRDGDDHAR